MCIYLFSVYVYVKPHPDVQTWLSLLNCLSLAVWCDVKDLIQNMTWKTAARAESMSGFCDLAFGLIKEAIHLVCEKDLREQRHGIMFKTSCSHCKHIQTCVFRL